MTTRAPTDSASHLLAGVGRANNANNVGNANNVYGVAGSTTSEIKTSVGALPIKRQNITRIEALAGSSRAKVGAEDAEK